MTARFDADWLRARLPLLAEVAAVLFTVLLRVWVTRGRFVYSVTSDEASQLAMARTLSGSRPFHVIGPSYDAGYGFFLAPIYALVEDPELAFRLVLVANVALAGVTLLVLRTLLVRLLDLGGPAATWSAAIALALPGAAMQTPFSGSEVLVVLVIAVVLLAAVELQVRSGWWPVGLALVGAVSMFVHARLTGVVVVVLVLLVASAIWGETPRRTVGIAVVLLVVSAVALSQLNDWVYDLVWLDTAQQVSRLGSVLDKVFTPGVLASAAGMAWHQMVVTFGLVVVGVGHLLATAVRVGDRPLVGPRERQRWAILMVLAAAAVPAAIFMAGTEQAGKMVYGRYWDALAVPVVTIGVGFLLQVGQRRAGRALAGALLVTGGASLAFLWVRQDAITAAFGRGGFGNPRRVIGLLSFLTPEEGIDIWSVTVLSLAGLAIALAVVVVARRHYRVVVVLALVAIATTATARASISLNERDVPIDRWKPATNLVEDGLVPDDEVVAFQLHRSSWPDLAPKFPFTAYQFYEPDLEFVGIDGDGVLAYDYVVADDGDPMLADAGYEIVYEHPGGRGLAVWRRT